MKLILLLLFSTLKNMRTMEPFSAEERRALFSSISLETIEDRPDWLPNFYKSQSALVKVAREKLTPCCECGQIGIHGGGCAYAI